MNGSSLKQINIGNHKRIRFAAFVILGVIIWIGIQAYTAKNYTEPKDPSYSQNYAPENPKSTGNMTVISYNIWFGEDIEQALLEIKEIKSQKEVDIILLQEMDEAGTEQMARELQMNYVYFPAAIEPTYDKNFGNAILSRWPISDVKKIILPHQSLSNRMNRIATKATIKVSEGDILVYSVHTESVFTLPSFREDQYKAILDDIDPEARFVIVGGDFNSFAKADVEKLEEEYQQAGLIRVSESSGYTFIKYGIGMSSDHIFAKGFVLEEAGKMEGAIASDHLPIWVTLIP
jgi:endonuclease/exonuclease/phosphatase family metal-dependent hydrolase